MKSQQFKPILVSLVLILAIGLAYGTPRAKYQSSGVIKTITLPNKLGNWTGEDVKEDINLGQDQYAFIGDIRTKKYVNPQGMTIYFTLLDADNFHNPKVCFTGAGYTTIDLQETTLTTLKGTFQAPTVYFKKTGEDILLVYWLCIDKQRVNWTGQKLKELWFSFWGRKKTGFTVRLDMPVPQENIKPALVFAQDFVKTLSRSLPKDQADYIFGK